MTLLNENFIKTNIADSDIIFKRGENIFHLGNYALKEVVYGENVYKYVVDGSYGDYNISVKLNENTVETNCDCPYPGKGCKHLVAACLDIVNIFKKKERAKEEVYDRTDEYMSYEQIRQDALYTRKKSAEKEKYEIFYGDTYKGEHEIENKNKKRYTIIVHKHNNGHCNCPDFRNNRLLTCKHLLHFFSESEKIKNYLIDIEKEVFPFLHIYWDSYEQKPAFYCETLDTLDIKDKLMGLFDARGFYKKDDVTLLYPFFEEIKSRKDIQIDSNLYQIINEIFFDKEVENAGVNYKPDFSKVKATLYPYQKEGVLFGLFKKAVIIGDEMGLGKTLQAITLAVLKKEFFNFSKVLIVCPTSLKDQWKHEIEKFTDEKVFIVAGGQKLRRDIYLKNHFYFKITNYEAVLRDILILKDFCPDLLIIDEAQRIKNFNTKTHQAIKSIPHKQSIVLTGTPLENKLEELFAIVQFAKDDFLGPLWFFATKHFIIENSAKKRVLGCKELESLHKKLKDLIIRRKKVDVLDSLPEIIINDYYVDITGEQEKIHNGYLGVVSTILSKKFITHLDMQRVYELLNCARMVCNSTYLIDKKTNISPKLKELEKILSDITEGNNRKIVIFSEWTTMTYLIGKLLSDMSLKFVEFTGKIPTEKRSLLINEFLTNPDCRVFLSTEAGGLGLNLQEADCVINFELPWNPAKLNQRIGRVSRLGQKSKTINVVNLITKFSIEERIYAGINMKQGLFDAVFDGNKDEVDFSVTKRDEFINNIREMIKEQKIKVRQEKPEADELPEDTPDFLNPEVFRKDEEKGLFDEESSEEIEEINDKYEENIQESDEKSEPENLEKVLNEGLKFLSGIMALSTGKTLNIEEDGKNIVIDKSTGEVTIKFKLPGFEK